jgi:hypothetical protein
MNVDKNYIREEIDRRLRFLVNTGVLSTTCYYLVTEDVRVPNGVTRYRFAPQDSLYVGRFVTLTRYTTSGEDARMFVEHYLGESKETDDSGYPTWVIERDKAE